MSIKNLGLAMIARRLEIEIATLANFGYQFSMITEENVMQKMYARNYNNRNITIYY